MAHTSPSAHSRRWWTANRHAGPAPVHFASTAGVIWTVVIALDMFFLSNPLVLWSFDSSGRAACGLTLAAVLFTRARRVPAIPWTVAAFVGFSFLSALWSTYSRFTLGFATIYFVIAVVALAIVASVDARTIAQGFLLGGVLMVSTSYYTLKKGWPGAAVIDGTEGYMAGLGTNRNILAYTLVLSLALALAFFPRRPWSRALWLIGIALTLLGIYLSASGTGYLAAAVLIALASVLAALDRWHPPSPTRSRRRRWTVRVLAVVILVGAVAAIDVVGRILNRDLASLSGRVPLWKAIWTETAGLDRWIGAGGGAVWPHQWYPAVPNTAYDEITVRVGYALAHGHNSLFDVLPELGLIGVALVLAVYAEAVARGLALRVFTASNETAGRLEASRISLLGVTALVIFGVSEPMSTVPLGWFTVALLASGLIPAGASALAPLLDAQKRTTGGDIVAGDQDALDPAAPSSVSGR